MRECDEKEKANRIENRNNIIETNMINCSKHETKYQGITQEREIEKFSRLIGSQEVVRYCDVRKYKEHCNVIDLEAMNVFIK